jgi:hypothetical protein
MAWLTLSLVGAGIGAPLATVAVTAVSSAVGVAISGFGGGKEVLALKKMSGQRIAIP